MKRSIGLIVCTVVTGCLLMVSPASGQKLDTKDVSFAKEAAEGGMLEVKLGKYAMENGKSEAVKMFGKRMVEDHSKANMELMTVAANKGIPLPKELDKKCQEMCDKLTKLKGAEFDKEYMRHMVEDHEMDVAKFAMAAKSLQDPELKAWAFKTLPVLNEHLRLAKEVHAKVEMK